jgi:hypothetical protein
MKPANLTRREQLRVETPGQDREVSRLGRVTFYRIVYGQDRDGIPKDDLLIAENRDFTNGVRLPGSW